MPTKLVPRLCTAQRCRGVRGVFKCHTCHAWFLDLKDGAPFLAGLCSVERAVSSVALQRCHPLYGEDCGRFTPGKETRYPFYRWTDGPQGRSGRVRKISPPPGFDTRIVQPVASRYADWAIAVHYDVSCRHLKELLLFTVTVTNIGQSTSLWEHQISQGISRSSRKAVPCQ